MKIKITFLCFLFASINTHAATFEIVGPCSETPVYQGEVTFHPTVTVAEMTKTILDELKIPYKEAGAGFSSIMDTPIGSASLEYLSAAELRAYGWCYSVDGVEPSLMPGEFSLSGHEHVRWWYAFSHLKSGEWVSYCEPAYTVKPASLCKK